MIKTQACVIGAGPAGYVCAIRLAQWGVRTVLVEKDDRLGGVCLNWGCIPSKAYIAAAKLWNDLSHAGDIGIDVQDARLDLRKMRDWKNSIVQRLAGGIGELMKRHKVEVVRGRARFVGKDRIEVQPSNGGSQIIEAGRFVIATGSRSIDIPGFKVDEDRILSSTGALDLTEVPKRLLVIGGGVIGLEIGMYLMKFGTALTVVELAGQILPGSDPDCVKVVSRTLKKAKATVHTQSRAVSAKPGKDGVTVAIETPKKTEEHTFDRVLVAVGRRPNTEDLGLDKAGVDLTDRGFVKIDAELRTSNPGIFAAGDVTGPPLLAHKGSKEGLIAAAVIAGKGDVYDVRAMPAAIFTDPEIASVGLTEAQAREKGLEVRVGTFPFAASGRALAGRETDGLVKIISDAGTDALLGCHIAGPHASELIAEAALAIEAGLSAEDLALTVHTHPTLAETLMEAAEDVHGLAVHIYNPKRPAREATAQG